MPRAFRFVLVLLLPFALLAVVELLLRLAGVGEIVPQPIRFDGGIDDDAAVVVPDDHLLFRLAPDSEMLGYYRTNAAGYRGADFAPPRDGTLRIVALGDSCTFGLGVREDAAWPKRLEALLSHAFEGIADCEVLNLGVPGYSSWQNAAQLESELEDLRPAAAVWMITGYNDAVASPAGGDAVVAAARRGWLARIAGLRLLHVLGLRKPPPRHAGRDDQQGGPVATGVLAAIQGLPPRVPAAELEAAIARGTRAATAAGIAPLLVVGALRADLLASDDSLAVRHAEVLAAAARLGIPCADPRPRFALLEPFPLHSDAVHPDARGQVLVAITAFEALVRGDDLPATPRRSWLRAVLAALDGDVAIVDAAVLRGEGAPARFTAHLAALEAVDPDAKSRLAAAVDPRLAAADPMLAPPLARDEGRSRLAALGLGVAAEEQAVAAHRAAELFEHTVPRDPFATLLFPAGGEAAAPGDGAIALARAITAWAAVAGLSPLRIDRRAARVHDAADPAAALRDLDAALELVPQDVETRVARIEGLKRAGRHGEAVEALREALAIAPDDARLLVGSGLLALMRADVDVARGRLARGLELDPVALDGHYGLARIALFEGDFERARHHLHAVRAIAPSRYPDVASLLEKASRGERIDRVNR
jgi:tetratricopeptide (TPR) repeat protein